MNGGMAMLIVLFAAQLSHMPSLHAGTSITFAAEHSAVGCKVSIAVMVVPPPFKYTGDCVLLTGRRRMFEKARPLWLCVLPASDRAALLRGYLRGWDRAICVSVN